MQYTPNKKYQELFKSIHDRLTVLLNTSIFRTDYLDSHNKNSAGPKILLII